MAQENRHNRVLEEYLLMVSSDQSSLNERMDDAALGEVLKSHAQLYLDNQIPERYRIQLYRNLFKACDIRAWQPELKTIVLYRLVKSDISSPDPAYKLMESGYGAFVERVNTYLATDFAFLNEWKVQEMNKLKEQGIEVVGAEFDEKILQKAIHKVYMDIVAEIGESIIDYQF